MVSSRILNHHLNINLVAESASISAPDAPSNFLLGLAKGSAVIYVREGDDLLIELGTGEVIIIKDFFLNGIEYHNLVFSDGMILWLVDFSHADSANGLANDGVIYHPLDKDDSAAGMAALLGILGAFAAGATMISGGREENSSLTATSLSSLKSAPAPAPELAPDPAPMPEPAPAPAPAPELAPAQPAMPNLVDNTGSITGEIKPGAVTDEVRPDFSGVGEKGSTIIISDKGEEIGRSIVGEDGTWVWRPDKDLEEGKHVITVVERDLAGNESDESPALDFEVDTSKVIVAITGFKDDVGEIQGVVNVRGADGIWRTDDATPTLFGLSIPNAVVQVTYMSEDGQVHIFGQTVTDEHGHWSVPAEHELAEGRHTFTAEVKNPAGSMERVSVDLVIDKSAPDVRLTKMVNDEGAQPLPIADGGITNDTTPSLSGTTEAHARVRIYEGDRVIGDVRADAHGNWNATLPPLSEGKHEISITATDDVGNESDPITRTITVDTEKPIASAALTAITEDTGVSDSDFITSDNTLIYSFTSDRPLGEDESIWMRIKSAETGKVVSDWRQAHLKDGIWQIDDENNPRPDGRYEIETVVRDKAGNEGALTKSEITIAGDHPDSKGISITNYHDHVGKEQGDFGSNTTTDDRRPTLNGVIDTPLSVGEYIMVTMRVNGVEKTFGPATISSDGKSWSLDVSDLEQGGSHHFTAKIVDVAGNESAPSHDFIIDVGLTINIDGQTTSDTTPLLTGSTGFALFEGEYVEVRVNGKTYSSKTGEVVIDPRNATWYLQIPDADALPAGTYEVEATLFKPDGTLVTTDDSEKELEILPVAKVDASAGNASDHKNEKATAVTMDENGNWMIFTNNAIMRAKGTDNATLGDFDITKVQSQKGGGWDDGNHVQNGTWIDYDRDGYMDFFGSDDSPYNGQQAFLNEKGQGWRAHHIGLTNVHGGAVGGTGNGVDERQEDYNPEGNAVVWYGGMIAFDKLGNGLASLVYGDQTSPDPGHSGGAASAIVVNTDGTIGGFTKDEDFQTYYDHHGGKNRMASNRDQMQPDMELSGVDLNNDGTVDLVFHGSHYGNHIGKGGEAGNFNSYNTYRLVVASNEGTGEWNVSQIIENVFHRPADDTMQTNGVAMTWADFDGDGYMDLFMGRGFGKNKAEINQSRILFNDGHGKLAMDDPNGDNIGKAGKVYKFDDQLAGGASLAVDWNHDGKMDIIELPTLHGISGVNDVTVAERVGTVNLYTNTSSGGNISFTTSNLLGGNKTIGNSKGNKKHIPDDADWVTGAVAVDVDWDGAKDLLIFTRLGDTRYIHNDNKVEDGTVLHFKILDAQGINAFFGNTVQLYDSKGRLVGTQIINPQSGNQTNDSTGLVDFYGLDPNETYSLVMFNHKNGSPSHIGGLVSIGGKNIQNVNSAWTGIKAGAANEAIILTAEAEDNIANANKANGIVGTGYNDTFIATKGEDAYFGGGGTVTISGEKRWSDKGGIDIVDYKLAGNVALNINLSKIGWQDTGFNLAKFTGIEGIAGASGDDVFTDDGNDNVFNGRGGNDTFNLFHGGRDTLIYELIDANDATGGNGADEVNGFTIGAYETTPNADRIDLSGLLIGYTAPKNGSTRYIDGKPVIDGGDNITDYLQVRHKNGNTELWIDRDGKGGDFDAVRLVTLNNVIVELEELLANHQIVV